MSKEIMVNSVERKKIPKKWILIVVSLIVVSLISVITLLNLPQNSKNKKAQQSNYCINKVTYCRTKFDQLISDKKYSQAESLLNNIVQVTNSEDDYINLAKLQSSEAKYDLAYASISKAESRFGKSFILINADAEISIAKNQPKLALTYYQEALKSLNDNPSQINNPQLFITSINQKISYLNQKAK